MTMPEVMIGEIPSSIKVPRLEAKMTLTPPIYRQLLKITQQAYEIQPASNTEGRHFSTATCHTMGFGNKPEKQKGR